MHAFHDSMAEHVFERARSCGFFAVSPADDPHLAAHVLLCPTFHADVGIRFADTGEGGLLEVMQAAETGRRLRSLELGLLPADESTGLAGRLVAALTRPRALASWAVLDGIAGAVFVRAPDGTTTRLGGHLNALLPHDPVSEITTVLLAAALQRAETRAALRALESVAAYFEGFEPVRVQGGPPWTIRIVQSLSSSGANALYGALARVDPADSVLVDLSDCESIAGMFWRPLVEFDRTHPRTRWRAAGDLLQVLLHHGIDPDRIEP